jgi:hypothetical protein
MAQIQPCTCPHCCNREPAFGALTLLCALVVFVAIPGRALAHVIAGILS